MCVCAWMCERVPSDVSVQCERNQGPMLVFSESRGIQKLCHDIGEVICQLAAQTQGLSVFPADL